MKQFKPKENGVQLPWLEDDFVAKWQEWLKYRSERRLARYVPTGLKMTFTRLIKDSGGDHRIAIQMIDQSLEKGWQGIFPLKTQNNGKINSTTFGDKPVPKTVHQGGFGQL